MECKAKWLVLLFDCEDLFSALVTPHFCFRQSVPSLNTHGRRVTLFTKLTVPVTNKQKSACFSKSSTYSAFNQPFQGLRGDTSSEPFFAKARLGECLEGYPKIQAEINDNRIYQRSC